MSFTAIAQRHRSRGIPWVDGAAPEWLPVACQGAGGYPVHVIRLVYRGYGRATLEAKATFQICVDVPPGERGPVLSWKTCGWTPPSPSERAEESERDFPGVFKFSHIVRCHGRKGRASATRLFYGITRENRRRGHRECEDAAYRLVEVHQRHLG